MSEIIDVVIVGGGPAGLSAALALGRACRRVVVCDAGPRRNELAHGIQNFVTRDGIPPNEFRQVAREQLKEYPSVEFVDEAVVAVEPQTGTFSVTTTFRTLQTRRILLCTGVVDEPLGIEGTEALWGRSIFQCPYCHGWERRNLRWGYLASNPDTAHFALLLRQWTPDVTLFTHAAFELPGALHEQLTARGVRVESRPIARVVGGLINGQPALNAVAFADGGQIECDVLFAHPKQRAVPLIQTLGLALDDSCLVIVDPMTRQTSVPGIYAAGDVVTRLQAAIVAAASGTQAAAALNHALAAS